MTRDQELWAIVLHVEREHGGDGPAFIAEQIGRNALEGEQGGIELWTEVARRYERLSPGGLAN